MRVRLSEKNLNKLFYKVFQKHKNWKNIPPLDEFSLKTINDWRKGKYTLPLSVFQKLVRISSSRNENFSPVFFPDFWHVEDAGRKGALETKRLYGNFGTPEGRRLGGLKSIITHQKRLTNFKTLKKIKKPKESEELAEFLGLLMGDGHVSDHQVSFYTNLKTDYEYALFVKSIIKKLFNISSSLKKRKKDNTVIIVSSSKKMVDFLRAKGMPIGNKIKNNLKAPKWIFKKLSYQKLFIRGLFDTDGCIFLDKHRVGRKTYKHLSWNLTSYAKGLINDIIAILERLGFSPTHRDSQKSVYLRKQDEIRRYFKEIRTNNVKHKNRFCIFTGKNKLRMEGCAER